MQAEAGHASPSPEQKEPLLCLPLVRSLPDRVPGAPPPPPPPPLPPFLRPCSILFITPCLGFAFRAIPLVPSEFAAGLTLVRAPGRPWGRCPPGAVPPVVLLLPVLLPLLMLSNSQGLGAPAMRHLGPSSGGGISHVALAAAAERLPCLCQCLSYLACLPCLQFAAVPTTLGIGVSLVRTCKGNEGLALLLTGAPRTCCCASWPSLLHPHSAPGSTSASVPRLVYCCCRWLLLLLLQMLGSCCGAAVSPFRRPRMPPLSPHLHHASSPPHPPLPFSPTAHSRLEHFGNF